MDMNGGLHRQFLTGEEEVQAFRNAEFIRMHSSTLSKVGFFNRVMEKMIKGQLQTNGRGWGVRLDRIFEGRLAKGIGFTGTVSSLVFGAIEVVKLF